MKKLLSISLAMILLFSFTGCGGEKKEDAVQNDLINYNTISLAKIKKDETTAIDKYNEICQKAKDLSRDEILNAFNNEIIPAYTTFCNNLNRIAPTTKEVQQLKNLYVEGADLQLQGMTNYAKAIQENDTKQADSANEQLNQGKEKINQHRESMITLAKEHHITIEE